MSTSLSVVGLLWAIGSFLAAAAVCFGYFMPYWLTSTVKLPGDVTTSFGTFRRCGYQLQLLRTTSTGLLVTSDYSPISVDECGRYRTFQDIPSVWWQVSTVTTGVGCCTALLVAFAALACCCVSDVMSKTVARVACIVQFLAAVDDVVYSVNWAAAAALYTIASIVSSTVLCLCVAVGCVLYPIGWNSYEVRQVCGDMANRFNPGTCRVSWAFWTTVGGASALFVCCFMAVYSAKRHGGYQRAPTRA